LRNIETDLRPSVLIPTLSKLLESYLVNWMVNEVLFKLDQKQGSVHYGLVHYPRF